MQERPRIQRKPGETRLWVTMPYDPTTPNRGWMQQVLGGRKDLQWNKPMKRWEIARTHLRMLTAALADRFGEVEVLLEFDTTERCTTSCQTAGSQPWECTCECLGKSHGGRGEKRDWVKAGPHQVIARDKKMVHFLVLRGEIPVPAPPAPSSGPALPESPAPAPAIPLERRPAPPPSEPNAAAPEPTPARPAPDPEPSAAATPDGELQPGCGTAAFTFAFAMFSLLALGISPWWWIGSAAALLVGSAALIDHRNRRP
ncbi:hypothetical protein ACWEVD_00575 [Nocardia thailandica]